MVGLAVSAGLGFRARVAAAAAGITPVAGTVGTGVSVILPSANTGELRLIVVCAQDTDNSAAPVCDAISGWDIVGQQFANFYSMTIHTRYKVDGDSDTVNFTTTGGSSPVRVSVGITVPTTVGYVDDLYIDLIGAATGQTQNFATNLLLMAVGYIGSSGSGGCSADTGTEFFENTGSRRMLAGYHYTSGQPTLTMAAGNKLALATIVVLQ